MIAPAHLARGCMLAAVCFGGQLPAQVLLHGPDARADFDSYVVDFGTTFIDFNNVPVGPISTSLQSSHGVTFWSTVSTSGSPINPPHNAYISSASVNGDTTHKLIGTPFAQSGADDGRVGYEIRFDLPQSHAGLIRNWQTGNSITSFFNAQGDLLGTHTNTANVEFVAWIADMDDPSTWVSTIQMDGNVVGGFRQVGYSDDLFFGTAAVPEPSVMLLFAAGAGLYVMRRRRGAGVG